MVSSTDHEASHYIVPSTLLLPRLSLRPKYLPQRPILKHPQPIIHTEKSNKMQQCIKILFHIYIKVNMFQATHHPSSGA